MQEQKGSSSPSISTLSIVQMNDVSASYDSKDYVLKNIQMSITRGANYAIVGQSGSGKSTLLKLINGMMNPSRGKIMVDYKIPNTSDKKFKPFMHKIGYIPQNLGLIKNSTVLENVLIGALPRVSGFNSFFKKFSDLEINNAKKILKLVGLQGKAERKVYMLSGGEKRRVAIARALVQKPEIILADEIVSELDHVTAREIMDVLAEAQATMKLTAIMVHHDLQLALEYADRVAVIKEGEKVLEIGVEGDKIVDFQSGIIHKERFWRCLAMNQKNNLIIGLIIAGVVVMSVNVDADPRDFAEGLPNIGIMLQEITEVDSSLFVTAFWSMLETIEMAFIGTVVGVAISLPLSLLAARNLNNKFVYVPIRALLAAIRTFPSILWAILFVIIVGLGPFAGVLAIIMYTGGFIAKLQYEAIEAIDADPMDAVGAIGVSKLQLIRFVVLPESASHLLSQILYIFDYNIRQTSILGLVGAGGIGFYIINYIKFFEYGKAAVFMLVVLATVLIIEWVSVRVRDKYIVKSQRGMQVKS